MRRALAGLLGLLLFAAVGVAALDIGYGLLRPLAPGSVSAAVPAEPAEGCPDSCLPLRYRAGRPFHIYASVRNGGPFPVVITGIVATDPAFRGLYRLTGVRAADRGVVGGDPDRDPPFAPFAVAPGEEHPVWIDGRFVSCENATTWYMPGGGMGQDYVPLRFRLLFLEHETEVELPAELQIMAPERC